MELSIDGVDLDIAAVRRAGKGLPTVFLHRFGSTKEDFADGAHRPSYAGRQFIVA